MVMEMLGAGGLSPHPFTPLPKVGGGRAAGVTSLLCYQAGHSGGVPSCAPQGRHPSREHLTWGPGGPRSPGRPGFPASP